MIQELFQDRLAVLNWLRQAPPAYVRWLESMRDQNYRNLKNADELIGIYRSQGEINILERLLSLETKLTPVEVNFNAVGQTK